MTASLAQPFVSPARRALERGRDRLLAIQHERGYWKGELETNVTMEAEDLLLREFLGIRDDDILRDTAAWIRSRQGDDGGWAIFHGGPPDLSATIEAYTALRVAGDSADATAHATRRRARARTRRDRAVARVHAHLVGAVRAVAVGATAGAAARGDPVPVVVPAQRLRLRVVGAPDDRAAHGGGVASPAALARLRARRAEDREVVARAAAALDLGGSLPGARPRAARLREASRSDRCGASALALCAEWILKRQEADGCWGGIQPPWVYSIMALHLLGYSLDHPALRTGLEALETFAIRENGMRRFEACQSPVWDTALAMVALRDAGVAKDDPAMLRGGAWLLDEEIRVPGDWSVKRPQLEPGGWAFEFANDNYPDIDDTAEVILALRAAGADPARSEAAVRRAVAWTFGMQCRDGGFAAFDVDNTSALCGQLPFCDFGEVTDPPSADVVAHVIEMLADEGLASDPRTLRAPRWLLRAQEPDGSWFGRWGINYVYGTGAAVPALVRTGIATDHASIRRAVRWLETRQNADGGWGEDPRSYKDAAWRGRGASTPSQTAWALLALLAAGERGAVVERGVAWLVRDAARRRRLGRAALHRHGLSRATSTSATTSTDCTSR